MKLISGLLLSILLLGVGCSFTEKQIEPPNRPVENVKADQEFINRTSKWVTLDSPELGLQFKYPKEWALMTGDEVSGGLSGVGIRVTRSDSQVERDFYKTDEELHEYTIINAPSGKYLVEENYDTPERHFISARQVRGNYVYKFEMEHLVSLSEMPTLFRDMITTFTFTNTTDI